MVIGLTTFRNHFAGFADQYVLIGGVATQLQLHARDLVARATKDLDIVLCVEASTPEFGRHMWEFIRDGGYAVREVEAEQRRFHRFQNPATANYPAMLEFFSRAPGAFPLHAGGHLTPVTFGSDVTSLSAILLDDDYYEFIHRNTNVVDGVTVVSERCLIPLKARAWTDLSTRAAQGHQVDGRDIRKHLGDVLRLAQLLDGTLMDGVPDAIRDDVLAFLDAAADTLAAVRTKDYEIHGLGTDELTAVIRSTYARR